MSLRMTTEDEQLRRRVQNAVKTAQAWDSDADLLKDCRSRLPWKDLCEPSTTDDDDTRTPTAVFVQRLCRYFQKSMTWVNQPACRNCGRPSPQHTGVRGPETDAEKEGLASRVEIYNCQECHTITNFPRYNAVRTLLETRKGRCGEYANLFGLTCRSVGLSTRYVMDVTDHVWVEVLLPETNEWIMADGCEGVINEPSMYEKGWGKELSVIVAAAVDHVVEVTPRYTRQFSSNEFMARRRQHSSSEEMVAQIVRQANEELWRTSSPRVKAQGERICASEQAILRGYQQLNQWQSESYSKGRISGSLAWKVARGETGKGVDERSSNQSTDAPELHLHVETFYPALQVGQAALMISLKANPNNRHDKISVCKAPCAVGEHGMLSVVVMDEKHLGCVLQSRGFDQVSALCDFVDSLRKERIVAMNGQLQNDTELSDRYKSILNRLGGIDTNLLGEGLLYVGQVETNPDWAACLPINADTLCVEAERPYFNSENTKLKTFRATKASGVVGRVPDSIMPLQTQLLANHVQKRKAFESTKDRYNYPGYTTRPGAPIYLLGATSFPLLASMDDSWTTFLHLPSEIVPDDDMGIQDDGDKAVANSPLYEVPVDFEFFVNNVGSTLRVQNSDDTLDTCSALRNIRLVGFYFSAHWCGPCRSFTPLLAETYEVLKSEFPAHGLEIIFVSSDRDEISFDNYFRSMPWMAIPFRALSAYKNVLSTNYGVRGIPALVVLDAMNGQVVVSAQDSRREILDASRRGEEAVVEMLKNWMQRVSTDSRALIEMLSISCQVDGNDDSTAKDKDGKLRSYLQKESQDEVDSRNQTAEQIKTKFAELVQTGIPPNEAAAKAISMVSSKEKVCGEEEFPAGSLNGSFCRSQLVESSNGRAIVERMIEEDADGCLEVVLSTVLKYVENVRREPWTPKFRTFKLSNKIADRVLRYEGGISLLAAIGLHIFVAEEDFVALIPLDADVDKLYGEVQELRSLTQP